jgi:hypothetical protein
MLRSRQIIFLTCAVLAFCLCANIVAATSLELTTADGQTVSGELVSWNTDRIELAVEGGARNFAPTELLSVQSVAPPNASKKFTPFIELADESRLPITDFTVKDRVASVVTPFSASPLSIPADQIRLVQWNSTEANLPSPEATGDCVAVVKKDSSNAEILTGIIGEVTAEQVEFTWEGETVPVKRSKIAALSFFQKESRTSAADPLCSLTLGNGTRLVAGQLQLTGDDIEATTLTGITLRVPLTDLIDADYSAGKLSFLSDLKPLQAKWTPLIEIPATVESLQNFGAPRMNRSFTGSPLKLLWQNKEGGASTLETYDKGLALRSRTELEYRLPKNMRRFVATAGIDPDTLSQGEVLLQIEADGEKIFEQTISGKQQPVAIDADISGKQKLRIFVDYAGNLDLGDRLHLVEARLVK